MKFNRQSLVVAGLLLGVFALIAMQMLMVREQGVAAPSLELLDLDGRPHRLADYRGQVVLLNFWATWCPPCREEMPGMWRLKQRLADKPFTVIAVDVGEELQTVKAFLPDKMQQDFVVLLDVSARSVTPWKVSSYPTSFLIDDQGRVRAVLHGAVQWDGDDMLARVESLIDEAKDKEPLRP